MYSRKRVPFVLHLFTSSVDVFLKKKTKKKKQICLHKNVNMNFNISQEMCALQQQGLKLTDDDCTDGAK